MATERTWEVLTASNGQIYETEEAQANTAYTYSFQKNSKLLYFLKEALVNSLDWHVVSSSYRSDGGDPKNSTMTYTVDNTDGWVTGSSITDLTGTIAPGYCIDYTAGGFTYQNAVTGSGGAGRSWILLKHSSSVGNTTMQENSGDYYHLLLDYCSAIANPNATSVVAQATIDASLFGNTFNIVLFPKAPSNPHGTPSKNLRPHDESEAIISRSNSLFTSTKNIQDQDKLYTLKDTTSKGFIFLIGGGGNFRGFFAMNTYSDHPDEQAGKVFAMAYSQAAADLKLNSTTSNMYQSFYVHGTPPASLSGVLIVRGVSSYSAGTYTLKPFVVPLPVYYTTSGPFFWMTSTLTGKTLDYSYVEWPLPVLELTSTTTYRFKGRIPDIKLGPSAGIDGLMSKPTNVSAIYDRVLLSGIWFPWASDEDIKLG